MARLSLVARDTALLETLAEEVGGRAFSTDLTVIEQVSGLIERVEQASGPVDIVINNAAAFWLSPLEGGTRESCWVKSIPRDGLFDRREDDLMRSMCDMYHADDESAVLDWIDSNVSLVNGDADADSR